MRDRPGVDIPVVWAVAASADEDVALAWMPDDLALAALTVPPCAVVGSVAVAGEVATDAGALLLVNGEEAASARDKTLEISVAVESKPWVVAVMEVDRGFMVEVTLIFSISRHLFNRSSYVNAM